MSEEQENQNEETSNAIDDETLHHYEQQEAQQEQESKEGEYIPDESKENTLKYDAEIMQLLQQLGEGVCNGILPNWEVQPEEIQTVSFGGALMIEKHYPNAKEHMSPEFILISGFIAIAAPRLLKGTPMKKPEPKPEPEKEDISQNDSDKG